MCRDYITELLRNRRNKKRKRKVYPGLVSFGKWHGGRSVAESEPGDLLVRLALIRHRDNPSHKPCENGFCNRSYPVPQRRGAFVRGASVSVPQTSHQEAVRQEDQTPMTFDTPQVPELIVFKAEILFGIPVEPLDFRTSSVCGENPARFPLEIVRGKICGLTLKLLIVVADHNPDPSDPFEIERFRESPVWCLTHHHLPEGVPGKGAGKVAHPHVGAANFHVPIGLQAGNPSQRLAVEKSYELLRSIPIVEQHTFDFQPQTKGLLHKFFRQVDLGLERDSLFVAVVLLEVKPKMERMDRTIAFDEEGGDEVVGEDVSVLAVVLVDPYRLNSLAGLVGERIVDDEPSLALKVSLGLEGLQPCIVYIIVSPYAPREEAIEGARMPPLKECTVDTFHGKIVRDDQAAGVRLEMPKGRGTEVFAVQAEAVGQFIGKVRNQRHCGSPRVAGPSIAAASRDLQAFISRLPYFFFASLTPSHPEKANSIRKSSVKKRIWKMRIEQYPPYPPLKGGPLRYRFAASLYIFFRKNFSRLRTLKVRYVPRPDTQERQ